jgi:hypothetical protein
MAKVVGTSTIVLHRVKKTTSIGKSTRSRPKNKHAKRMTKKYRGQGK